MEEGADVPCFTKLSETPLKVLTVKNVKLNVQNTLNLDELIFHCCFSWVLTINSKSTHFLNIFWSIWNNAVVFLSLLSFSRIGVYLLMEKQYMAKFALVFYEFLVFGNMFTIFFISYKISLLFARILQCLNSFFV